MDLNFSFCFVICNHLIFYIFQFFMRADNRALNMWDSVWGLATAKIWPVPPRGPGGPKTVGFCSGPYVKLRSFQPICSTLRAAPLPVSDPGQDPSLGPNRILNAVSQSKKFYYLNLFSFFSISYQLYRFRYPKFFISSSFSWELTIAP